MSLLDTYTDFRLRPLRNDPVYEDPKMQPSPPDDPWDGAIGGIMSAYRLSDHLEFYVQYTHGWLDQALVYLLLLGRST